MDSYVWAKWSATNADNTIFYFEYEPVVGPNGWEASHGRWEQVNAGSGRVVVHGWEQSLRPLRGFPRICDGEYNVGSFNPVSFTPKLTWTIIRSEFLDTVTPLPRSIVIRTEYPFRIVVSSSPYSYGWFTYDAFKNGFGHKAAGLDTHDPEEAVYLTELRLLEWAKRHRDYYQKVLYVVG